MSRALENMINNLIKNDENLDEAIKEASDSKTDTEEKAEVTEAAEETEETKEAEVAETDTEDESESDADLSKIADMVVERLKGQLSKEADEESDKVDVLVDELNKEAEELGAAQERIVTAIFNDVVETEQELDKEAIEKLASEEDSKVPHIVGAIYEFAKTADEILAQKYDEDYEEADVVKMAEVLIASTEDPFGFENEPTKEAEEAEETSEEQSDLDKLAEALFAKMQEKAQS